MQLTEDDLQAMLPEGVTLADLSDEDRMTLEAVLIEAKRAAEEAESERKATLQNLSIALAEKRQRAIAHRSSSGIEDEWVEDEEFYQGIDDANRHEFPNHQVKPLSSGATRPKGKKSKGSTVFPNITQPFTDAAAARMGDILLPTDDRNFALRSGPIPDLLKELGVTTTQPNELNQQAPMQEQTPIDPNTPVQLPNGVTATAQAVQDMLEKTRKESERRVKKAQERIDDWLKEAQFHNEVRRAIDDMCRLGSGVLKGPVPVKRRAKVWVNDRGQSTLIIQEKIEPASFRIDPWNLFPSEDCGEDIHKGSHIWEREYASAQAVKDMIDLPGVMAEEIEEVLREGPVRYIASGRYDAKEEKGPEARQFEIWHFHGVVTRSEMMAAKADVTEEDPEFIDAAITMINDRVVKAAFNPLGANAFPYDVMPWKRRPGMPWGSGVPRQIRTPQRMVVAASRNLMDNAGFAAGAQIVAKRDGIEPVSGGWTITPYKMWYATEEIQDVKAAFSVFQFPLLVKELQTIIQMAQKMAEDVTGLPALLQGQQGSAPDTVGGMTMLTNNANSVLRRVARLFDAFTEDHIGRYYAWLLEYGDDPEEKGDLFVEARGSSALIERDIQNQEMVQILNLSTNPAFGWNPKNAAKEYLKSRRFDPNAFEYTEAELEELAKKKAPEDPRITAATINAQARLQAAQVSAQSAGERAQIAAETARSRVAADTDRDAVYVQAEMERAQSEHEGRMAELSLKRDLAMLDYANKRGISLDQIKADLAKETMRLNTTKQLAGLRARADQLPKPPIEPAGRAKPGQSYQA